MCRNDSFRLNNASKRLVTELPHTPSWTAYMKCPPPVFAARQEPLEAHAVNYTIIKAYQVIQSPRFGRTSTTAITAGAAV